MKPSPHRHHAAGKRKIRRRLDRPGTAPSPEPVITATHIPSEVAAKPRAIACGGSGVILLLVRKLGLIEAIDERLRLLKLHLPYPESDPVLNFASHAWGNGPCLDDSERRRAAGVEEDARGVDRIPEPTTAGDFGRRFPAEDVAIRQDGFDQTRVTLGNEPPPAFFEEAGLDGDGTRVATGACCQPGLDIASDGTWGDHPWIISLAATGEGLGIVNRPGNRPSPEGAAEHRDLAIRLGRQAGFRRVYLRGDTDFTQTKQLDAWDAEGVSFLFGIDAMANLKAHAADRPASDWVERPRPPPSTARGKPRRRPERVRHRLVRERGVATLTRIREDVAEVSDPPTACQESDRRIVVRQTIAVAKGPTRRFDAIRWRFSLTNDRQGTPRELVFKAHDRGDQENLITQLKGGAPTRRAAVDNRVSHGASRVMTARAWNLKAWFARSVPEHPRHRATHREQKQQWRRMEFKRLVTARILMPGQIVRGGPRRLYRLL